MIFSVLTPREFETFVVQNYPADYRNITTYDLLMDINIGTHLGINSDYDIIGDVKYLCYIGICNLDSRNKKTKNCSEACSSKTKYCYDDENRCYSKTCYVNETKYDSYSACHEFNRIKLWRNSEYFSNIEKYKVTPYTDIVPKGKNCRYGYKKCGIINENKDYLCLKNDKEFDCPINDIIVKSNNESIGEGYRSFKLGDKYLFVSHDKIDNYIIKKLSITLDLDKKPSDLIQIDNDSYANLSNYNYISFDSIFQPKLAFLNAVPFKSNFTYEEMMKKQGIIDKKKKIIQRKN